MTTFLHLLPGLSLILLALSAALVAGMCRAGGESDAWMETAMVKIDERDEREAKKEAA